MSNIIKERVYGGEFLRSDTGDGYNREPITIGPDQDLSAGAVLGKIYLGAASAIAAAATGNTGNGVVGAITVSSGAESGDWEIVFIEKEADKGTFQVFSPDGTLDGTGKVAAAYAGKIGFTIADGAADFVAGDRIVVAVSYADGSGYYVGVDPSAIDGSAKAAAILWDAVKTGTSETLPATGVVRGPAQLIGSLLDFGSLTDLQILTAKSQLADLGFVIR